jgi:hypothetical protein
VSREALARPHFKKFDAGDEGTTRRAMAFGLNWKATSPQLDFTPRAPNRITETAGWA